MENECRHSHAFAQLQGQSTVLFNSS